MYVRNTKLTESRLHILKKLQFRLYDAYNSSTYVAIRFQELSPHEPSLSRVSPFYYKTKKIPISVGCIDTFLHLSKYVLYRERKGDENFPRSNGEKERTSISRHPFSSRSKFQRVCPTKAKWKISFVSSRVFPLLALSLARLF